MSPSFVTQQSLRSQDDYVTSEHKQRAPLKHIACGGIIEFLLHSIPQVCLPHMLSVRCHLWCNISLPQLTSFPSVIELALTEAAKEGMEGFSLTWLRRQSKQCLVMLAYKDGLLPLVTVHKQARRAKRRLGPRLNKYILHTLEHEVG
jgi:hypothetical protein